MAEQACCERSTIDPLGSLAPGRLTGFHSAIGGTARAGALGRRGQVPGPARPAGAALRGARGVALAVRRWLEAGRIGPNEDRAIGRATGARC